MFFQLFTKKQPFGLSISDSSVHVLQLGGGVDSPKVIAMGQSELPPDVVVNGEIRNSKILSEKIQKLLSSTQPGSVSQKECVVAISEIQCFEHIFYFPLSLQGEDLRDALFEEITKNIPIPSSDLSFVYNVYTLPKAQVIFVVAMRRSIKQQYEIALKESGLSPVVFEPESLSLLRNISVDFDMEQIAIFVHAQPDGINWFALWSGLIFDVNIISHQSSDFIASFLSDDIYKSSLSFQEKTGQIISKVVVLGKHEIVLSLSQELMTKLKIPVETLEKYRFVIPNGADPADFSIVSGAALRAIGLASKVSVNLLKE